MEWRKAAFIVFVVMTLLPAVSATNIAVDLAHGENTNGLTPIVYNNETLSDGMLNVLTQYRFFYFGDPKYESELGIMNLGGNITYDALKRHNITMLLIGQPLANFTPDEVSAIRRWLEDGGRVLWIAADSDYGNGAKTQEIVDRFLTQLNMTNLRVDLCSVEDPVSNVGGKSYRVVAYDDPWKDTPMRDILVKNLKHGGRVLTHGPGVIAWVDEKDGTGNWHQLNETSKPKYAYVIVHSNSSSDIVENSVPAANAYQAGDKGAFPIVAAQIVPLGDNKQPDVIIISGETPYGGYLPIWTAEYYNISLDGPTFVSNLLKWAITEASVRMESSAAPRGTASPATQSESAPLVVTDYSTTGETRIESTVEVRESPGIPVGYLAGAVLLGVILIGTAVVIKRRNEKQNGAGKNLNEMTVEPEERGIRDGSSNKDFEGFPQSLLELYEPIEFLGEGGFARVFKVKRRSDGKIVALKIPRIDEKTSSLFLKEVAAWYNLNHENIVRLYKADILPVPYIEMEFVEGVAVDGRRIRNLDEYPKPVDEDTALRIIRGTAEGLKHAHSKGIYHLDLKPLNVLLKSDLTPKITDWGLARISARSSLSRHHGYSPLYAAPEQLDEETFGAPDHRTDIYQLGLIFYELLTGELPYNATSPGALAGKILGGKPKKPSEARPELAKYDGIFERLLAKRKEDRYQSVEEFLSALNSLVELEREKEDLKKTVRAMKESTSREEFERLKAESVRKTARIAVLSAKLNDKAELLTALDDLRQYTWENLSDLESLISQVEMLAREGIPISDSLAEKIEILVTRIEGEVLRK